MDKRKILIVVIITAVLLLLCACILAVQENQSEEILESSSEPIPTNTPSPTPTPTEEPTPTPTVEPTPEPTPIPEEPTPMPEPAVAQPQEAQPMGYGISIDLNGDGVPEEVRFDPADLSPAGNIQLAINDTVFDTAIPAGSGGAGLYMGDVLTSDPYTEMFLQVLNDTSSSLYVFRYDTGTLTRAMTTYTLPAYLSATGADEQFVDADSIVFYGVHPILVMGDGTFGLLYGDTFTMFQLDGEMHFSESGMQPANVIMAGATPTPEAPVVETLPETDAAPETPPEPEMEEPNLVLPDIIAS